MTWPELTLLAPLWLLAWPFGPIAWWALARAAPPLPASELFGCQAVWRHPAAAHPGAHRPAATRAAWVPLLTWTCLLLALAQPVRLGQALPAPRPPVDLYVLLDTSVSMVLRDYRQDDRPVDRLTFAKGLLDQLAADYGGDRLGLYLVGSPSRRLLAPTPDHGLFRQVLARVETTLAGRRAELGDALARLAGDLAQRPRERQAIALLVSDGTQPSGRLTPAQGAEQLRQAGVPLYVLAIGAGLSEQREAGGLLFGGARVVQLEQLAAATGGQSFAASDVAALEAAMRLLGERYLATASPPPRERVPLYHWLLLLAVLVPALAGLRSRP